MPDRGTRQPPRPRRGARPPAAAARRPPAASWRRWKLCRINIDYPSRGRAPPLQGAFTTGPRADPGPLHDEQGRGLPRRASPWRRTGGTTDSRSLPPAQASAFRAHSEWSRSRLIRWTEKIGPGDRSARGPRPNRSARPRAGVSTLSRQHAVWGGVTETPGSRQPAPVRWPSGRVASTPSGAPSPPARTVSSSGSSSLTRPPPSASRATRSPRRHREPTCLPSRRTDDVPQHLAVSCLTTTKCVLGCPQSWPLVPVLVHPHPPKLQNRDLDLAISSL